MTKEREALKLALEALEKMDYCCPAMDPSGQDAHDTAYQTMHILRTVINEAQPEQESFNPDWVSYRQGKLDGAAEALEGTKRTWVGLTDKDSELVYEDVSGQSLRPQDFRLVLQFAVALDAKLKELNHD